MEPQTLEHIEGTIEDIVYHNEETTFTVLGGWGVEVLVTGVGQSTGVAEGEEISAEVFEAHAEEIFDEAENRLHAQKAVMYLLMKEEDQ